jgi:anti-sigma factor RsiW
MNHPIPPITDDDLHAYVDGKLDAARWADVDAYLCSNPGQRHRVDAWIAQREALRTAFDPIVAEPLPSELVLAHIAVAGDIKHSTRPMARSALWFKPPLRAAAGLLIAVGIGGAAGWIGHGQAGSGPLLARDTGTQSLALESKAAFQIFAGRNFNPQKSGDSAGSSTQANIDPAVIGTRIGGRFRLPDLSASGFQRIEVDWVATIHGPAASVLYRDQSGNSLILLVRKMEIASPSVKMVEHRGRDHTSFSWIHNGIGYAVIADAQAKQLHHLANKIRDDENAI